MDLVSRSDDWKVIERFTWHRVIDRLHVFAQGSGLYIVVYHGIPSDRAAHRRTATGADWSDHPPHPEVIDLHWLPP